MTSLLQLLKRSELTELPKVIKKTKDYILIKAKDTIRIPLRPDKDLSYIAGVIVGDGNISITKRKICRYPRTKIRVYNDSRNFLIIINNKIKKIFSIKGRIYKKNDSNCYILELNNKLFALFWIKIIGLKTGKKIGLKVPKRLKRKKLFKYFLAGLFDTDGYFTSNIFGIMMNGDNAEFLKEIKGLSKKFYDLNFYGPHLDTINQNGKTRKRAQINLTTKDNSKFQKSIPCKRWAW